MQSPFYKIILCAIFILLFAITLIAYQHYKSQQLQQQAFLIYKLADDFYYRSGNIPNILRLVEENKPILKINGGEFKETDLDDYLGFFEGLDLYVYYDVLRSDWVDDQFGYYIARAYKNEEIKEYLIKVRKDSQLPEYLFAGFESRAKKIMQDDSIYIASKKK